MITVRQVVPAEWALYRDLRLQALRDAPDAFGSTYEAEAQRSDELWSARVAAAFDSGRDRVFFARNGAAVCGLVWCKVSATEATVAEVFQMWVEPASRGSGAGRALLAAAVAWAQSVGVRGVRLGVTTGDSPATRLYTAQGFRPVGDLERLREASDLMAQTMVLELPAR